MKPLMQTGHPQKLTPRIIKTSEQKQKQTKKTEYIQVFIITNVLQITLSYDINRPCVSKKKSEDDDNNSTDDDSKDSEQAAKYGPLSLDYMF